MEKKLLSDPTYSGVPLTPDNFLQVDVFTSQQNWELNIDGLAYNIDGTIVPFRNSYYITNILTVNTFVIRLGYFALLSIVASTTTGTVPDGSTFCRITLVGASEAGIYPFRKHLSQGYLSYYQSVGYGSNGNNDSGMDHKYSILIQGSDPAQGDPFDYNMPPWYHLTVQHIRFQITTDATAANRYLYIVFDQNGSNLNRVQAINPITASRTVIFDFYPHCVETAIAAINRNIVPMPNIRLDYQSIITINAINLQTSDQISAVQILGLNQVKPN